MLAYFRSRGWDQVDVRAVLRDPEVDTDSPEDLEHLDLSDNGLRDLDSLAPFRQLASINVSCNRIEALDHLPPSAQRVIAPQNRISSLQALTPHHLQVLDVSHNPLSTLQGIQALPLLRTLRAASCQLEDLQPLSELSRLDVLDVAGNRLTLSALGSLRASPSIRTLCLASNPAAADTGRHALLRACFEALPHLVLLDGERVHDDRQWEEWTRMGENGLRVRVVAAAQAPRPLSAAFLRAMRTPAPARPRTSTSSSRRLARRSQRPSSAAPRRPPRVVEGPHRLIGPGPVKPLATAVRASSRTPQCSEREAAGHGAPQHHSRPATAAAGERGTVEGARRVGSNDAHRCPRRRRRYSRKVERARSAPWLPRSTPSRPHVSGGAGDATPGDCGRAAADTATPSAAPVPESAPAASYDEKSAGATTRPLGRPPAAPTQSPSPTPPPSGGGSCPRARALALPPPSSPRTTTTGAGAVHCGAHPSPGSPATAPWGGGGASGDGPGPRQAWSADVQHPPLRGHAQAAAVAGSLAPGHARDRAWPAPSPVARRRRQRDGRLSRDQRAPGGGGGEEQGHAPRPALRSSPQLSRSRPPLYRGPSPIGAGIHPHKAAGTGAAVREGVAGLRRGRGPPRSPPKAHRTWTDPRCREPLWTRQAQYGAAAALPPSRDSRRTPLPTGPELQLLGSSFPLACAK